MPRIPPPKDRDYFLAVEAAKFFGVDRKTITHWANRGYIPYILSPERHRRYPKKEIRELVKKQKEVVRKHG